MIKKNKKKTRKPRNSLYAAIIKEDPSIIKTRVKKSDKGKGRKNRPRKKKVTQDD